MYGAVTTAQPLADAVGLPVQTRDGFAEIDYGGWDGLSAKEVAERFPMEYARWTADPAWNPPTGGETAVALAQRVTRELEAIEHTHHQGGNVLIVAHKATIRVAICALLGVDVGRFRYRFDCPVGSVTIIEFREHGPFAFAIADRSHLDARLRGPVASQRGAAGARGDLTATPSSEYFVRSTHYWEWQVQDREWPLSVSRIHPTPAPR